MSMGSKNIPSVQDSNLNPRVAPAVAENSRLRHCLRLLREILQKGSRKAAHNWGFKKKMLRMCNVKYSPESDGVECFLNDRFLM